MIVLPVLLLVICTGALGTVLPQLHDYVEARSRGDAACRENAETLTARYQDLLDANRALFLLRQQCPAAKAHPLAAAALASLGAQIVLRQKIDEIRIGALVIVGTGDHARSQVSLLVREPPGDCGIAGDLRVPCAGEPVFSHQSEIAGFAVFCRSQRALWTYALDARVGLP